jgi:hypothetical protein
MKRNAWFLITLASLVMTLMTSLNTFADDREFRSYDREIREMARRNGYQYGFREGRRDRRSFDFRRNRIYRSGTAGCRGAFDCNDLYREVFRHAFENGYREAYYRGGWGWDNPWWRRDRYDRDDCDVFGRPRRRF